MTSRHRNLYQLAEQRSNKTSLWEFLLTFRSESRQEKPISTTATQNKQTNKQHPDYQV